MKLQNKVAVITGAASGMGKAIAVLFASEGARVVVADLRLEAAQQTVDEIHSAGGQAIAVAANVAQEQDVQQMIDTAVSTYGTVDILINNAGIMDNFTPAEEVTDELWERVFAVNTTGVMRAIRKVLPIFKEQGKGAIVNIASAGGLTGSRAGAAYTASKHAVVGLTRNVGFQYAPLGIRCNAIAPGGVKTAINASMNQVSEFGQQRVMGGMQLMPRVGEPEEIAAAALFLASDDASFINATVLTADAGWTAY
ncbi:SDR family oxidoreductase [Paenibacillus sp. WLX1005]|uniref:SDR family oxidoreductase n=1 Tax=unclassified Paenibacillus TaxID=185978 RepID=UPI003984026A